jgi:hypothetical protein
MADVSFAAWVGALGYGPDAYTPSVWTLEGSGGTSAFDADAGELTISTSGDTRWYQRSLMVADTKTSTRQFDRVDVQAMFRVTTDAGSKSNAVVISDGVRVLGFAIGGGLHASSPLTGNVLTLVANVASATGVVLRVVKDGTSGWWVYLDGKHVATLPYHLASAVNTTWAQPLVAFGQLAPGAGANVSVWSDVEVAINAAVAPTWKVIRARDSLPVSLRDRWTALGNALIRVFAGQEQHAQDLIAGARAEYTASRQATFTAQGDGSAMPGVGNTLAVQGSSGSMSVVRQRLRVASESSGPDDGVEGAWGSTLNVTAYTEYRIKCTMTVVAINATGATNSVVGPYLEVREGYRVRAALRYDADGYFWTLVRPSDNTNYGPDWRIDPYAPHVIELLVLGRDRVMLVIDGQIVAEEAHSSFQTVGNATTSHSGLIARSASATTQVAMDLENMIIQRRGCDLERRPMLEVRAAERLIAFGGCERNDRLETWIHNRHGVHQLRGVDHGIQVELARIACSDVLLSSTETPYEWFLDVTWPEVSPVILESTETKLETGYFVTPDAPGMTVQDIATWAAQHLLPTSTMEHVVSVGLYFLTTGAFSASGLNWVASYTSTGETDAAVPVGARIEVRKANGTAPVFVLVVASGSGSLTVSGADLTGYNTGSYIIATLATS